MPAAERLFASAAAPKCGHLRDAGYRRTSSTRARPWARRISRNSSSVWFECPRVRIRGKLREHGGRDRARAAVRAERGTALDDHDVRLRVALPDLAGEA